MGPRGLTTSGIDATHNLASTGGRVLPALGNAVGNLPRDILQQAKALIRAIEALETIQKTGPLDWATVWLSENRLRLRNRMHLLE